MSLVRCPGCRLHTSDSLPHCPNCGIALHGGASLFEQPPTAAAAGSAPKPSVGIPTQAKAIGLVVLLIFLSLVPHAIPLFVVALVFWLIAKRQKSSGQQSQQMEIFKILVNEARRPRSTSSTDRPLEMLKRIEHQLKTPPRA